MQLIEDTAGKPIAYETNTPDSIVASLINTSLMICADFLNQLQEPVFYYSEPEYHLHMRLLSLHQNSSRNAAVREKIQKAVCSGLSRYYS